MKRTRDNILVEWLVLGAQGGDQDALNSLVQLMYPKLLRYASRQLNDQEAAKDVVQNAFEVLSKDLRKVHDPAAFTAWIYRITQHKCIDGIRRVQRQRAINERYEANIDVDESARENHDDLDLTDALNRLESESYRLVHLYYLEGFTTREVASILDIAEGTVKSRLFQVRKKMKSFLSGEYDE